MIDHIVAVGAGLAGVRCLTAVRQAGFTGRLTLLGAEPHPPYDRPPLSKRVLAGNQEPAFFHTAEELANLGIQWRGDAEARALEADRRAIELATGDLVGYDRLVITTGAAARPFPGADRLAGVFTLRTLDDSIRIRAAARECKRVVVVGGGVLGCEVAATLNGGGLDVTLIEPQPTLLARVLGDSEIARSVATLHRASGVTVRLGTGVRRLTGAGRVDGVLLDDGSAMPAELVVVALGARPATEWLAGSRVEVHDGVLCDRYLRTTAEDVFAAGDVARIVDPGMGLDERAEHWTNAADQAEVAARNLLSATGTHARHDAVPYVWSEQFGRKIQVLGRPHLADTEMVLAKDDATGKMLAVFGQAGRFCGAAAISMAGRLMKLRPLLAATTLLNDAITAAR